MGGVYTRTPAIYPHRNTTVSSYYNRGIYLFPPAVMNNSTLRGGWGRNGISTYIDVLKFMIYIDWFNKKFSCPWTDGIR